MAAPRQRALITGLSGFTGRYLADELAQHGYEVFGTGSAPSEGDNFFQVDLGDAERMRELIAEVRPDVVVHLAALAFVGHGNPEDFYRVNLLGTRHLLEALVTSGHRPRCVLLASSANVYGNASAGLLDENTLPAPVNDYAVSKLAMEYMASLWRERLPLVVARPFNYTGIGQDEAFLLPKIVSHFRRRAERIELGNLDVSRDFSDVRTVAHIYRRLVEEPAAVGGTFNISSGTAHSLRSILDICEELTGHHMAVDVNPAFVRASDVRTLRGDNTKLRSLLGNWEALPLKETLRWMLFGS